MRTINGCIRGVENGRFIAEWPGVDLRADWTRGVYEGKEYLLLDHDSFPGMAKMIDEEFTHSNGDVLVLTAESEDTFIYNVYGNGTSFTQVDAKTGKVKINRHYLNGVLHGIRSMRELLEELSYGSTDPVADFIDGNFGE